MILPVAEAGFQPRMTCAVRQSSCLSVLHGWWTVFCLHPYEILALSLTFNSFPCILIPVARQQVVEQGHSWFLNHFSSPGVAVSSLPVRSVSESHTVHVASMLYPVLFLGLHNVHCLWQGAPLLGCFREGLKRCWFPTTKGQTIWNRESRSCP